MSLALPLYIFAFFVLWFGAGLIITSVERFSKKLHLSSFAFSFFALGILTSIPEIAVGMNAVVDKQPEVFVGNLIGGIPVIFLLIIPILAILGNGVKLKNSLSSPVLFYSFAVMLAPAFFVLDKRVTNMEAVIMLAMYIVLFHIIERKKGIFDSKNSSVLKLKAYSKVDILKVLGGIVLVFISSSIILDNTLLFAQQFKVSPFYISLIFLSLGTNLPEFSLAIRAAISGRKDVAFGDYVGSAAANTMIFGILTLINVGEIITVNNFIITFITMSLGLGLFLFFTKSKNDISRKEGFLLLLMYGLFVFIEQMVK